jgi:hypothetical protein
MSYPARENPLANIQPTPRVVLAARLWKTSICKTKKEASIAAGLHPNYLTMLTAPNGGSEAVKRLCGEIDKMVEDQTVDMSHILRYAGRKAIGRIAALMDSSKEEIALKAAQDLADRAPETQKTQRVAVESFSLNGEDARELAKAIMESSQAAEQYREIAINGLDEATTEDKNVRVLELPTSPKPSEPSGA